MEANCMREGVVLHSSFDLFLFYLLILMASYTSMTVSMAMKQTGWMGVVNLDKLVLVDVSPS